MLKRAINLSFASLSFALLWFSVQAWYVNDGGALNFSWPKWLGIGALAAGMFAWALAAGVRWVADEIDLLSTAFLAWATISVLWSFDKFGAVYALEHLAFLWLILQCARRVDVQSWLPWCFASLVPIGIAFQTHETTLWGGLGNPNDLSQVMAIMAPFMLWPSSKHWSRYILIVIGGLSSAWVLAFSTSRMGWIALGAALFAIGWRDARKRFGLIVFAVLFICVAFMVAPEQINRSLLPRLQVWMATIDMWINNPLIGVGLNSFEPNYPDHAATDLRWWPSIHQNFLDVPSQRPGAAHGDWLQLGAELGLVGFAIGAGTIALALWRYAFSPAWLAVWIAATLALVDFPLQKPGSALIAILALACLTKKTTTGS